MGHPIETTGMLDSYNHAADGVIIKINHPVFIIYLVILNSMMFITNDFINFIFLYIHF